MEFIFRIIIRVNAFTFVVRPIDGEWRDRAYYIDVNVVSMMSRDACYEIYVLCFNENDSTVFVLCQ